MLNHLLLLLLLRWIPDGQLCPTVPNRANYIHWIDDLLLGCPAPWHATTTSSRPVPVRGLDIGTGANCIYPLLGASMHGWHFVGTGKLLLCCFLVFEHRQ